MSFQTLRCATGHVRLTGVTGASISTGFGRDGLASTDLTVFARLSKWGFSGGENASIHCEVEMKYSSDFAHKLDGVDKWFRL